MIIRRLPTAFSLSRRFFSSKNTPDFSSSIAEFNKELEDIFGGPPASGPSDSSVSCSVSPENLVTELSDVPGKLTHVGSHGKAQMVDVSPKEDTKRTAIASCKVILGKKVFDLVSANQLAKGDVLSVAKIAGIMGAKHAGNLIPLCHNICLSHVHVDLALNPSDYSVDIQGEASTTAKTGVEMEAMTAVTVAGLTVYDMCKAASKNIEMTNVRLERKTGGKSGEWTRKE
ncbi:cyclic pyranopterin monophosphate synthase, mitochondrial [Silene latifolia]|uniref:cyclic pyranopterin monophosphate synthase, mitochondrial n=1 Tax=Silene latifolia TaxID=37657 RepID=UPI003D76E7B1